MNGAGATLRDIHLPEPVSWWPPGPGWWIVLILVVAAAGLSAWLLRRRRRRTAVPRAARREMARIEAGFARDPDPRRLAVELSELLRRIALSRPGGREAAGLTGERWLAWLDKQAGTDTFSRGIGRVLIEAPYRPDPDYDAKALLRAINQWLETSFARRANNHG